MDFSQILAASWQFFLVVTISFAAMCLLASHIRFQNLARQAIASTADGMDPHDAFQVAIAHALGTAHMAPEPFSVFLVAVHDSPALAERCGHEVSGELQRLFEARVRASLRASDIVIPLPGDRLGVILEASYRHAHAVVRRVLDRVAEAPFRCASGLSIPLSACVGGAAHPEHGDRVAMLLERADASLQEARAHGAGAVVLPDAAAETEIAAAVHAPASGGLVDPLTGLLRPEKVGPAVQKYVARYRRQEKPVSLLLFDVDHLDRYNEHYGREAGDALLHGLGGLLQSAFREGDLVARLGGEEFLVVMPCSPASALIAGQRVVSLVKRTAFAAGRGTLKITVSGGIAGYPDHGGHPRHLLDRADAAMNEAKSRGHNMCLVYEPSMRGAPPPAAPADVF